MSAAAASRDVTLFHAHNLLHEHNYDVAEALKALVPTTGPMLCRDEMEDWSASEANLFEEAIEKYGKDFNDIRKDFLPWKSIKNIIEYFFMWKTTDRYVNCFFRQNKVFQKIFKIQVCATEENQSFGSGVQTQASIRAQLHQQKHEAQRIQWRNYYPGQGLRRLPQLAQILLGPVQKIREIHSRYHVRRRIHYRQDQLDHGRQVSPITPRLDH